MEGKLHLLQIHPDSILQSPSAGYRQTFHTEQSVKNKMDGLQTFMFTRFDLQYQSGVRNGETSKKQPTAADAEEPHLLFKAP